MLKQKEAQLHILMCLIGGFAGTYSLLRCHDTFGAAQTASLILAVKALLGGNIHQFILRVLGLAAYMAGIFSFTAVSRRTDWNPEKWVLTAESICLLFIGLLPSEINFFICLYLIFYMLAAQWTVFHGACGYNASTIFSSNNVKQFTLALGAYCLDRDTEQARKAKFFGLTLLCYHAGAAAAILFYHLFHHFSIWICYLPLLTAAWIIAGTEHEKQTAGQVVTTMKAS